MSFFGKTYNFVRHEKFDDWLRSVGLPDDKINALVAEKSAQKIVQNGDSYVITSTSARGDRETTFKSGVEFDDTIGDKNIPIKTTYTVDGNTVTQVLSSSMGTATFKREYNGDELVVSITGDKYDGVAKRYYKA